MEHTEEFEVRSDRVSILEEEEVMVIPCGHTGKKEESQGNSAGLSVESRHEF